MNRFIQFVIFGLSLGILVSYQNCAPSEFGQIGSQTGFDYGDDSSNAFGTVFLTPTTPVLVTSDTTDVTISGRCNKGTSDSHRIDWKFIPGNGNSYLGNTSWNQVSSACVNKFFEFTIPLGAGFDYEAGNQVKLRYYLFGDGEEETKEYYVAFTQGIEYEDDKYNGSCNGEDCDPCTRTITTGGDLESVTCEVTQPLAYNSAGYGGFAMVMNVKRRSSGTGPESNSKFYPIFHLYEIQSTYSSSSGNNEPRAIMSYATGKLNGSEVDGLTFEHLFYYSGFFPSTGSISSYSQQRQGKYFWDIDELENVDEYEAEKFLWKKNVEYTVYFNYSYPQSSSQTAVASLKVCLKNDTSTCPMSSINFPVPYAQNQLGSKGLKLIFGTPSGLVPSTNSLINFDPLTNWEISNVQWKLCETDRSVMGTFCSLQ